MTEVTKLQAATISFYDEGSDDGHIQMALNLPDDYDPENLRPFEVAALMVVRFMEESTDGFQSIRPS